MNLRKKQAQQTYKNIILTAEKLLKNSSYEELSVEQICECAGISKGGFYHHFPSKDQLLSLLIGRQMGDLIAERITSCINKKSAFELLKIYVDTTVEYLEKCPKSTLARCWVALADYTDITNTTFAEEYFQIIYAIVKQGKEEGSIRSDLSSDFCYSYINGTITGIILYGSTFREHFSLQSFASDSLKLICQTLECDTNI